MKHIPVMQPRTLLTLGFCLLATAAAAQNDAEPETQFAPQSEQLHLRPATPGITIPSPTIITQPNFKSSSAYGITTDSTGQPLPDHKIYSIDTHFFLQKIRSGISREGENDELKGLVVELEKALNQYDGAEGNINFEEQIRVSDSIDLDKGPTPRGTDMREQMKEAIRKMDELRSKISSRFGNYFLAGKLPEEKEP
jgi:hypothetical protein